MPATRPPRSPLRGRLAVRRPPAAHSFSGDLSTLLSRSLRSLTALIIWPTDRLSPATCHTASHSCVSLSGLALLNSQALPVFFSFCFFPCRPLDSSSFLRCCPPFSLCPLLLRSSILLRRQRRQRQLNPGSSALNGIRVVRDGHLASLSRSTTLRARSARRLTADAQRPVIGPRGKHGCKARRRLVRPNTQQRSAASRPRMDCELSAPRQPSGANKERGKRGRKRARKRSARKRRSKEEERLLALEDLAGIEKDLPRRLKTGKPPPAATGNCALAAPLHTPWAGAD